MYKASLSSDFGVKVRGFEQSNQQNSGFTKNRQLKGIDSFYCFYSSSKMLIKGIKLERTQDEILIKLLPDTDLADVQQVLNYFNYVEWVGLSGATQEAIDEPAKRAKKGWWEAGKEYYLSKNGLSSKVIKFIYSSWLFT